MGGILDCKWSSKWGNGRKLEARGKRTPLCWCGSNGASEKDIAELRGTCNKKWEVVGWRISLPRKEKFCATYWKLLPTFWCSLVLLEPLAIQSYVRSAALLVFLAAFINRACAASSMQKAFTCWISSLADARQAWAAAFSASRWFLYQADSSHSTACFVVAASRSSVFFSWFPPCALSRRTSSLLCFLCSA